MAIATVPQLREQLNFTADLGSADDALLARLLEAAQNHLERTLGFAIGAAVAEVPPRSGFEAGVPPALVEAVLQLAAWWYEQREAAAEVQLHEVPFGVSEIVAGFRDWSF